MTMKLADWSNNWLVAGVGKERTLPEHRGGTGNEKGKGAGGVIVGGGIAGSSEDGRLEGPQQRNIGKVVEKRFRGGKRDQRGRDSAGGGNRG